MSEKVIAERVVLLFSFELCKFKKFKRKVLREFQHLLFSFELCPHIKQLFELFKARTACYFLLNYAFETRYGECMRIVKLPKL